MARRQLGCAPAAAKGLDEIYGGGHPAVLNVHRRNFVVQGRGLDHDDGKVVNRPRLVLVESHRHRLPGSLHRPLLHLRLSFQDAQRGQVVLHLLECGKYGLAIGCNRCIIGCAAAV